MTISTTVLATATPLHILRLVELAGQIIDAQQDEIEQMHGLLDRADG